MGVKTTSGKVAGELYHGRIRQMSLNSVIPLTLTIGGQSGIMCPLICNKKPTPPALKSFHQRWKEGRKALAPYHLIPWNTIGFLEETALEMFWTSGPAPGSGQCEHAVIATRSDVRGRPGRAQEAFCLYLCLRHRAVLLQEGAENSLPKCHFRDSQSHILME